MKSSRQLKDAPGPTAKQIEYSPYPGQHPITYLERTCTSPIWYNP